MGISIERHSLAPSGLGASRAESSDSEAMRETERVEPPKTRDLELPMPIANKQE